MSEGEFHAYVGLLALAGAILAVLAARGFGQSAGARVVDGLFALGFLGYAGYLVLASPDTVRIFFYAFVVPVLGVVHAVRSVAAARAHRVPPPAYVPDPAPVPPQPFPAAPGARAADPAAGAFAVDDVPSPYTYKSMPSGLAGAPAPAAGAPVADTPAPAGPMPSGLGGAPGFSLAESGRGYTGRPSGLPEPAAGHRVEPSGGQNGEPAGTPHAGPTGGHHAEPAATAFSGHGYRPAHAWHEPRHASSEVAEPADAGRHRMPEPEGPPPGDWPPRHR